MGNVNTTRNEETTMAAKYLRLKVATETKPQWIWVTDYVVRPSGSISFTQVKSDGDRWYLNNTLRVYLGQPGDILETQPASMDLHYGHLTVDNS
jgi:PAS domain-containing protein